MTRGLNRNYNRELKDIFKRCSHGCHGTARAVAGLL